LGICFHNRVDRRCPGGVGVGGKFVEVFFMLSPKEAVLFSRIVMICYDNVEFRTNWEKLRKMPLKGKKAMTLFIKDVREIVFDRLPESNEK
jgi:hypothetical protein